MAWGGVTGTGEQWHRGCSLCWGEALWFWDSLAALAVSLCWRVGVPGVPSSAVSCSFGILPVLLLTLPVIWGVHLQPLPCQCHHIWRKQYQSEFARNLKETERCELPALESVAGKLTTVTVLFSDWPLVSAAPCAYKCRGHDNDTALSMGLYYSQAVEAHQLCLLNAVCTCCCFCSCLIYVFMPYKSINHASLWVCY